MPFTLTMPKMSPTMEEGTITKWHKKVGDFVKADEMLLEVATDKATVEYNALDSGWLRQIIIGDGKEAIVNQPIAIFTEEKEESIEGYQPEGAAPKAAAEQPSAVQPKKETKAPLPIAEPTNDAAQAVGQPKMKATFAPAPLPPTSKKPSTIQESPNVRLKASPLARKLAKQKGLDLSSVTGTGPGGRIVSQDLSNARQAGANRASYREQPQEAAGSYEEETLTPIRKVISQRLQEAKGTIPHFYVSLKIDAQPLIDIREQLKHHEIKLTYNDFVVKASALALRKHPNVNSGFNASTNTLIRFKTIDISIAVSIQGGLITPIVRHADFKSIEDIAAEIKELAGRAKEGKLEALEYKGGSFTISNLGMYGVSDFIAIINPPQAAILAVSGIQNVPVIRDGQIVPGHEMMLTLSGDHRVIDGVAGAEFLKTLQKLLENPAILLI